MGLGVQVSHPPPNSDKSGDFIMSSYLITLKIHFEALDDLEARDKTTIILTNSIMDLVNSHKADIKLQRLITGNQPEKVNFIYDGCSSIG